MIDIKNRLELLGIDEDTKHNIKQFYPVFSRSIDDIILKFYSHIVSFPEAQTIFKDFDIKGRLRSLQSAHWLRLFSCEFDDEYVNNALKIGQIHYTNRVAPYLYMAGYNMFHCEVIRVASEEYHDTIYLPHVLTAVTRVITLDMDLSLSAYTREHWATHVVNVGAAYHNTMAEAG